MAPGGRGVIRITYQPHKSEPGTFNKVIQIHSNSAAGSAVVTVQGNSLEGGRRGRAKTGKVGTKHE